MEGTSETTCGVCAHQHERAKPRSTDQLPEYSERRGWQVAEVYEDRISGGKNRRTGLDRLMADARRRKFDVVVVWKFDRFARSPAISCARWKTSQRSASISYQSPGPSTQARQKGRWCSRSSEQ